MNSVFKVALAATAASVLSVSAFADTGKNMNLSFRAGIFFAQGAAKAAEGQNWMTGGLELKLGNGKMDGGSTTYWTISADYYGKGAWSNLPVMYNYVSRGQEFYWSAGAGVGFTHLPGSSEMRFTYQLSAGKDFNYGSQPLFIEARYWGCTTSSLSGFSVVGGIRF